MHLEDIDLTGLCSNREALLDQFADVEPTESTEFCTAPDAVLRCAASNATHTGSAMSELMVKPMLSHSLCISVPRPRRFLHLPIIGMPGAFVKAALSWPISRHSKQVQRRLPSLSLLASCVLQGCAGSQL